jgi:hypothetical protein
VTAVVASVSTAGLVGAFTDTGGSTYATEIDNVAGAGCAEGFANDKFKPKKSLERGEAAAWLNRCGGRVAYSEVEGVPTTTGATSAVDVTEVQIRAGAVGTGTGGFVMVSADLDATAVNQTACPCPIFALLDDGRSENDPDPTSPQIIPQSPGTPTSEANMSLNWVVPVEGGELLTITLRAVHVGDTPDPTAELLFQADLVALYVPFGPDGDNTLAFES